MSKLHWLLITLTLVFSAGAFASDDHGGGGGNSGGGGGHGGPVGGGLVPQN